MFAQVGCQRQEVPQSQVTCCTIHTIPWNKSISNTCNLTDSNDSKHRQRKLRHIVNGVGVDGEKDRLEKRSITF